MTSLDEGGAPIPELVSSEHLAATGYITVVRDTIRFANGHEAERTVVEHPGAVALVVLDEAGRWLLIRQYRHAISDWLLEIPAGTLEIGEDPMQCAARELAEETGFGARSLEYLGKLYLAPGYSSEALWFFLATDLYPASAPQDDDEQITLQPVPDDEVDQMIQQGAIMDAKTVAGIMLARQRLGAGRR